MLYKKRLKQVNCKRCGASCIGYHFSPYCQPCHNLILCKKRSLKPRAVKLCGQCGTEFTKMCSIQKFCSSLCRERNRFNFRREEKSGKCKECGNRFLLVTPWQAFCGERCADVDRQRRRLAASGGPKNRTEQRIQCVCRKCSKPFSQPARFYSKGSRGSNKLPMYCSLTCAYEARKGMASPLFRGPANGTRNADWKILAKSVRERDGKLCVICSACSQRALPVDHVIPEKLLNKWGLAPHVEQNLVTLCGSCHAKKTHIENRLMRGDIVGFVAEMKKLGYPLDFLKSGMSYAGLSVNLL